MRPQHCQGNTYAVPPLKSLDAVDLNQLRGVLQVPSADVLPRIDSVEAVTAGSRATADIFEPPLLPIMAADKGSQVLLSPSIIYPASLIMSKAGLR